MHSAGRYDFARSAVLTRQLDNSPAAAIGQDLAAMLLGISERRHDRPQRDSVQSGDVRRPLLPGRLEGQLGKLTVNLGLRWEYEGAPTERDNRNARGFDPDAALDDYERGAGGVRRQSDPAGGAGRRSASSAVCCLSSDSERGNL